jgi:Ca-activated chloride channel family protein
MRIRVRVAPLIPMFVSMPLCIAQAADNPRAATFRIDAPVVLIPTTVMDKHGALVSGLPPESFVVSQDNVPQRIASFGEQDIPVSIGVVFDTSGSMRNVLGQARNVLKEFLSASNPEDEAFLYSVSSRPEKDGGFTKDFNSLVDRMMFTDAGGSTALVDTIYASIQQSRSAHNGRRALLVISDGMDNHSRYSKSELMSLAVEADMQIYTISVFDPPRNKKPIELGEERNGIFFLEELANRTGGVQIVVRDSGEINRAATSIAKVIRDQYLIGYVPENTDNSGKWHSIKVRVTGLNATAYARSGFFAK